ncbi:competence type IV pilus ATPase ComGA [Texcoconibacillus texcoconensis]|uniref:Competence protein ComGA n=1 Tax=Texcoconibacillus texcoconensis TaxID=1095777 RepID=A0A840QP14_9BACI|nr:competence type IV pilus ATPase ComGA [Texcoconibacillus texcoconensis]MBB5173110.1 competence protein ComGA [Texcoconibacillus texcoconensis]
MNVEQECFLLIASAVRSQASDVHLVPNEKRTDVRYRIAGSLSHQKKLSSSQAERLISHFKFTSGMDIGNRRKPQNGSLELQVEHRRLSLRLSTVPTVQGESLVIRLHSLKSLISVSDLCLFPKDVDQLKSWTHLRSGLCLLTGPTGTGKTTTLYSLLNERLELQKEQIVSLEDPVEKKHDHILQLEVNEDAGLSYGHLLKDVLRHDPDVIVIGEIRDQETASLVIRAALTGHVVFASLHAPDPYSALLRMIEFGIPNRDLSQCLQSITTQRLVKRRCPYCLSACTSLCIPQRSAVFATLNHTHIQKILSSDYQRNEMKLPSVFHSILKGVALGFIDQSELNRDFTYQGRNEFAEKIMVPAKTSSVAEPPSTTFR